jgi:hypothetical protein
VLLLFSSWPDRGGRGGSHGVGSAVLSLDLKHLRKITSPHFVSSSPERGGVQLPMVFPFPLFFWSRWPVFEAAGGVDVPSSLVWAYPQLHPPPKLLLCKTLPCYDASAATLLGDVLLAIYKCGASHLGWLPATPGVNGYPVEFSVALVEPAHAERSVVLRPFAISAKGWMARCY